MDRTRLVRNGAGAWGLILLVAATSLFLVRCKERPAGRPASQSSRLVVAATLPEGEIAGRASVDVIFDRPVVAMGAADPSLEAGKAYLDVEPRPEGYYHWLGTRTLSYVVPAGLPPATRFRASVPAGVRALDGTVLARAVSWEFSTPRPALLASVPTPTNSLVRPGDPIILLFNMPVDPDSVAQVASLDGQASWEASRPDSSLVWRLGWDFIRNIGSRPGGRWGFGRADIERMVLLSPRPPLQRDRAYVLRIAAGLRGKEGALGLAGDVVVPFRTYGPLALDSASPGRGGGIRLKFTTPVDADSLRAYIALDPPTEHLSVWSYGALDVSLGGDLDHGRTYRVRIRAGLPDDFGQRLAAPVEREVRIADREPTLSLIPESALLLPEAGRKVVLWFGGVGEVRFRARPRSLADEIRARGREEMAAAAAADTGAAVAGARTWPLARVFGAGADRNRLATEVVDLGTLLPASGLGAVEVQASILVPDRDAPGGWRERQETSFLRWTDLGLSTKFAGENGLVWVTRLSSGEPMAGAALEIRDDSGRSLWSGRADEHGLCRTPGQDALGRDPWNLHIVAAAERDTVTGTLHGDWRLETWRWRRFFTHAYGYEEAASGQQAFLYGDRDLYRPGETLHLTGLVRRWHAGSLSAANADSLRLTLRDPSADAVADTLLGLDRLGGFAVDVVTSPEAETGYYTVTARVRAAGRDSASGVGPRGERGALRRWRTALDERTVPGRDPGADWHEIGSTRLRLAAYRAPTFRAAVRLGRRHLVPPGEVRAQVAGEYFFGAPLAGARFSWNLVREHTEPQPPGFDEFSFDDPEVEEPEARQIAAGEGALGDSGTARVVVPIAAGQFRRPQALSFEASVQDPTGDMVAGRGSLLYHPAAVYPGVAVAPYFVAAGESLTVKLVAVRAETSLVAPGVTLNVEFVRREWRSVRKLLAGGNVGYETTKVDSLVDRRQIVSGPAPVQLRFAPPLPGSYRVRVTASDDEKRTTAAATWLYAAGKGAAYWQPQTTTKLELTADRQVYQPGDTARVLVTSALAAERALLSVEREGVFDARVVPLGASAQVLAVPLRPEYMPNVYIGVGAVEPPLAVERAPGLPPSARLPKYQTGYVELRLDTSSRRLVVEVQPSQAEYGPGERATLRLQVRDAARRGTPARVSLAVVDEAVLALLETPVPDPFAFFYRPRRLRVGNNDTRLRLSPGAEAMAGELKSQAGGGGDEEGGSGFRTTFATTAYWNPAVFTDAEGRAEITFQLPENLTSFRVAAVAAAAENQFGSGEARLRLTKPLTVEAVLPRFALVGDTLEVAALVTNRSARPLAGKVRAEGGLGFLGDAAVVVRLAPRQARRVAFRAVAARPGAILVRFAARLGEAADAVGVTLPVATPEVEEVAASAGWTRGSIAERVELPVAADTSSATLALNLSASAAAGAERAFSYVVEYPYGCVEQISSRLLTLALYKQLLAGPQSAWAESLRVDELIAVSVQEIGKLWLPGQGFAFWPGGTAALPPISAYAAFALARAQRAGAAVPSAMLAGAGDLVSAWFSSRGEPAPARGPGARGMRRGQRAAAAGNDFFRRLPLGMGLLAVSEMTAPIASSSMRWSDIDAVVDHRAEMSEDDRLFLGLALTNWRRHPEVVDEILHAALQRLNVTAAGAVSPAIEASCVPVPFRSATRATALVLLLAARVRGEDAIVPPLASGLLGLRQAGHWGNTQDDALALLALCDYRQAVEKPAPGFDAEVRVEHTAEPLLEFAPAAGSLASVTRALPLSRLAQPLDLRFEQKGKGTLYYGAVLRWREPALGRPARDGGYTLMRTVEPFAGQGPVRLGDVVLVSLQIIVPRESYYLAVRDPLPAGLEAIHADFATESRQAERQLDRLQNRFASFPTSHVEYRDREVRLFADQVAPGIYEYKYLARARAAGSFAHLPANIEAMYSPELNGASTSGRFEVAPPKGADAAGGER